MGKFILYTIAGTLATFAIFLHLSLLPHLMQTPAFAGGVTFGAVMHELRAFAMTLALSWIAWWGISGLFSLILYSLGKYTWFVLFLLSLSAIFGVTLLVA
jgi:hypothetical protein